MKKHLKEAPLYLGGWLILVGLRLFLSILAGGNFALPTFSVILPGLGQISKFLLVFFILYEFIALTLFAKRHKAFKRVYIGLEALSAVFNLSMFFISINSIAVSWVSFRLPCIAVLTINILWILYTLFSQRVRRTFVCNWNEKPDASLVEKVNGSRGDC